MNDFKKIIMIKNSKYTLYKTVIYMYSSVGSRNTSKKNVV